jgi:PemK-like, MazF-like toxin of type II toxin-antitoxin system
VGAIQPGIVVFVRFPFSDLSATKLRPAVVIAHAGGADWVLCQVTSNPYGDAAAVALSITSFESGGLGRESFARPGKLFTASESLFVRSAGQLTRASHRDLVARVVAVLQSGVRSSR